MPNNLSRFWLELKRRKVIRVITVYAAAAFVIIELVDIVAPNLGLPAWTFNLVLILLLAGFVITIIVSWIFDIHPEGGIVKTGPAHKTEAEDIPKSSNSWKIASYISFAVIIGLIVLNILPRLGKKEFIGQSIAVLPFTYLSDEPEKQYLAVAIMDEILLNLSMVKSLRVLPRTSVEQYRETDKTVTEICQELDVSCVMEGSFLKNGDQVRLILQLIAPGREGHIWAKNYDRNWADIFTVQSEIARLVAGELQAVIAPEEQQRIEKVPTANLSAYEIYLKANAKRDEFNKNRDQTSYETAVNLYTAALEMDSTFARVYADLADIYNTRYAGETFLEESYLDTVLILANKALSYDDQLAEAYYFRALYFNANGHLDEALANYDQALEINPNYADAYGSLFFMLLRSMRDYQGAIESCKKALNLIYGEGRPAMLLALSQAFTEIGMIDLAKGVLEEKFLLDGDSAGWLRYTAWLEFSLGNFVEAYRYGRKEAAIRKSDYVDILWIICLPPDYKDEYYNTILNFLEQLKYRNELPLANAHRIGYGFFRAGNKQEADRYFQMQIQYGQESIRLGRNYALTGNAQYDLAATYAFIREKEKAYYYLSEFDRLGTYQLWLVTLLKNDPLFNGIRSEPEFQRIQQRVEAKYQAEHERVRQWLEENDML